MKWQSGSIIVSGFMVAVPVIGLILGSLLFISPMQAGQMSSITSVDVAATAQAIQSRKRQVELETRIRAQEATWESEIGMKQQALAEFNRNAQAQLSPLQSHLLDLQAQLNQVQIDVETARMKELELQQAIQADEADFQFEMAELENEIKQLENELAAASAQLQATGDELDGNQTINPTLIAGESSGGNDSQDSTGYDNGGDSHNDGKDHGDKNDNEKEDDHHD